jgi:hypothetical protein
MNAAAAVQERPPRLTVVPDAGSAPEPTPGERLRTAGERVLVALVDRLSSLALEKVDDLAASLEDMAENGGPGVGAAIGAGKAMVAGRNVVWGAIKGAFAALSTAAKVLISVVLALSPVLLLVALVVLIVALLVWAVVAAVRAMAA